jgi:L-rhamnose mutarotase
VERTAFLLKLKAGMQEEYKLRHDNLWPEMKKLLGDAGIRNYSIWCAGEDLFGYFEADDLKDTYRILAESPVNQKWDIFMDDIVSFKVDPDTGNPKDMELMFCFP